MQPQETGAVQREAPAAGGVRRAVATRNRLRNRLAQRQQQEGGDENSKLVKLQITCASKYESRP